MSLQFLYPSYHFDRGPIYTALDLRAMSAQIQ